MSGSLKDKTKVIETNGKWLGFTFLVEKVQNKIPCKEVTFICKLLETAKYNRVVSAYWEQTSNHNTFFCIAVVKLEGITRSSTLPGFPSLDRSSRYAEVGSEPRTFRGFRAAQISYVRKCAAFQAAERATRHFLTGVPQLELAVGSFEMLLHPEKQKPINRTQFLLQLNSSIVFNSSNLNQAER
ncbi:hypothetical protein CSKR_101418 [Clonorchis sinensis]|uniref:Uncharacterized protein n=1 Tax=Clonorchis sinensis TaxID=79923 RepID=A0A3R7F939_CLOSI|nr:hypothetical protein CSKR_101418 [Clonorchis sinensis]